MYNVIILTDNPHPLYLARTLGPYKAADALRSHGYAVRVIDFLHCFSVQEIVSILEHAIDEHTLFVGFSTFFYHNVDDVEILDKSWNKGGKRYGAKQLGSMIPHGIHHNKLIMQTIKSCNPRCKLVLGGPDSQDAAYIRDYDYAVLGYADNSIVDLANHLATGAYLPNARRSIHGSTIVDDATASGYDFVNTQMTYHESDLILPGETLSIEISRGCIFKCAFCSYPLNGKRRNDHIKMEQTLYQEFLHNYENYGVTRYIFSDDTFNDSADKIYMLGRISKKLPFRLEYWAFIRLDLLTAHPETIDPLFDSGLRVFWSGIETLNPQTASIIGKGGDRTRMANTVHYIKNKYGDSVSVQGSFIFGLPKESVESMKNTAQFLLDGKFGLDTWNIYPLVISAPNQVYTSGMDRDPEKYGYKVDRNQWIDEYKTYYWSNDETDWYEMLDLVASHRKVAISKIKTDGLDSMYIASRTGLDYILNKTVHDIHWHTVDLNKQAMAESYRLKMFASLGMVDR